MLIIIRYILLNNIKNVVGSAGVLPGEDVTSRLNPGKIFASQKDLPS
jgi:hypothetical protein